MGISEFGRALSAIAGLVLLLLAARCGWLWMGLSSARSACSNALIGALGAEDCGRVSQTSTAAAVGFIALLVVGIILLRAAARP